MTAGRLRQWSSVWLALGALASADLLALDTSGDPRPVVSVRKDAGTKVRDLFAVPEPPKPVRAAVAATPALAPVGAEPPPRAATPTLPYVYLGRLEIDGEQRVFLLEGDRPLIATVGKPVTRGWRLVVVDEAQLQFKYEPTDAVQTMQTGSSR